jgi:zinc transport system substrate-binding protein
MVLILSILSLPMTPKSTILKTSITGLLLLATAACSSNSSDANSAEASKITVAAAFYPIEEIVSSVGGNQVEILGLTPPGEGAHDLQLSADQLADLENADVLFYLGDGFQPGLEKAVAMLPDNVRVVDLLQELSVRDIVPQLEGTEGETDGETLESGKDPHVWLDPANMVIMTNEVRDVLSDMISSEADAFKTAADSYIADLTTLGADFDKGLAECASRIIVTSHRAFEYLAARTNLKQVAIAGINPDSEPSTKSLEVISAFAKDNQVSTIFFETLVSADLATTIASEIGANTDLLDPIEGFSQEDLDSGSNYIEAQRANLERLRRGLQCS